MNEPAPAPTHGSALAVGQLVDGKYRLLEPAGEGAMGSVWKAEHVTLGSQVAIKFLHGAVASNAEARHRFEREAKLAARLGEASRHITRVTDHGITAEGTPFLVMEFLHGEGLEVRLKRERRLPIALVNKITSQLCKALHVAHSAGVIHRDLKPANIFLCPNDDDGDLLVKLLDFGVAKATQENDENQATRAGQLIGTPNYMSPEQIAGDHALDPRSDLWAAAAIAYRMAVGRAPFGSGSLSELAMRIVSLDPPVPTSLAPDLPHEFDLWTQKGLAKKPDLRFQTAKELAESLAVVAGVSLGAASTGTFSAANAEALALQLGDSNGALQRTLGASATPNFEVGAAPRKSRVPTIALALTMLLGVGGAAAWWSLHSRGGSDAKPAAAPVAPPAASTSEPAKPAAKPEESAKPVATAAPVASATEPTPSASVSSGKSAASPGTPPRSVPRVKAGGVAAAAPTTPETAPPPVAPAPTAAPTAADPSKTSADLWKKKDEM